MEPIVEIHNPQSAIRDRIRRLAPGVVNKIAAGEVIERPASLVKELVENALDAGATRIDVTVEGGGSDLVRVTDDGCGIPAEDLPLAVASHATSKLADMDDLFRVTTLGFRGEALASMAEVGRLELRSRTTEALQGARLAVVGGQAGEVLPWGGPPGTTVEVRDLFFNTPVRRKFLKAAATEVGHVAEAFTRLALGHTDRHFTLRHNDRRLYDLPAAADLRSRVAAFFGQELAEALIPVESREGDVRLSGYVAHPSHSRSHPRMQYLLLGGRYIRDRALQHALGEAYRGLLLSGRYPIAFLRIEMPPEAVDVNVHPTKLEVRFQDGGRLYSQLLGTLRTRFLSADLQARLRPGASAAPIDSPTAESLEPQAAHWRDQVAAWARGQTDRWASPSAGAEPVAELFQPPRDPAAAARPPLQLNVIGRAAVGEPAGAAGSSARPASSLAPESGGLRPPLAPEPEGSRPPLAPEPEGLRPPLAPVPALQIHNRYLVVETAEGLAVIDQHALHERILYEQLRARVLVGAVESQALLVPEPVELAPAEAAAAQAHAALLAQLGVTTEAFGGDCVLVRSYPAMLANLPVAEVLRSLVDQLLAGGKPPDRRDLLDELLHMVACKAAIKAGDRLTSEEIAALLEQQHLVSDSHHCPHGRPTALVLSRQELDRQFERK